MIAKTVSFIPQGYDASLIEIEGATTQGLPSFSIVGMANKTVTESRERVKAALKSSGFVFPDNKVTVNLAPADLIKDSPALDLAIAVNILVLSQQLLQDDVVDYVFSGELSLDGNIRPVHGIINIVEAAKSAGYSQIFVPFKNFTQASLVPDITVIPVSSLSELYLVLKRLQSPTFPKTVVKNTETPKNLPSFDDIKGQTVAKRALEIAIAGRHNILLFGPPGTGKTMLLKASLSLLPPLTHSEQISITKLHSLSHSVEEVVETRPFRTPHHTCTLASLIGGGTSSSPGEISLAHLGMLFLDELPEYPRPLLEALRQPLEDKQITISRANKKVCYPADFMLAASMNPCPCGYYGDPSHPCTCSEYQIQAYQKKLSGPLLDRIDLFVEVNRVNASDLLAPAETPAKVPATAPTKAPSKASPESPADTMTVVKNTITSAINAQHTRYHDETTYNASLSSPQIAKYTPLKTEVKRFLDSAATSLDLSARGYFKIIKIARTIADIDNSPDITISHITEALSFRQKSFNFSL